MEHLVNRGRDGNTSHHPTNRGKSVAVENSRQYNKTSVEKHPRRHSSERVNFLLKINQSSLYIYAHIIITKRKTLNIVIYRNVEV